MKEEHMRYLTIACAILALLNMLSAAWNQDLACLLAWMSAMGGWAVATLR